MNTPEHPPFADVTVVVVSYNHQDYVRECLLSIERQTLTPAQVIIIDDASTDSTTDVIDEFLRQRPYLQWETSFQRGNRGLCRNLNEGLARTTSTYFAYISADDFMLPTRLERQARALQDAPQYAASFSDAYQVGHDSEVFPTRPALASGWAEWPDSIENELFGSILRRNFIPAASLLIRTDALQRVGGYDETLFYEDWDVLLRLSSDRPLFGFREPLVACRQLESSLGHTTFGTRNIRFLSSSRAILLKHLGHDPASDQFILNRVWHLALREWQAGGHPWMLLADLWRSRREGNSKLRLAYIAAAAVGIPGHWLAAARALRAEGGA